MVYARISSDEKSDTADRELGVKRQIRDCKELAAKRGWIVEQTFVDNDVSASSGKVRPQYQALLVAIEAGDVEALVVWDVDRLTRTPSELEHFISLADSHSIALASVGGEVDLATPQGRLTARIKGSVARHEVEQSSRRLRRKFLERAEAGKPHGKVAFGYQREPQFDAGGHVAGYKEHIEPEQARVIQDSAKRLLAGETLRSVVKDLNEQGSTTPGGTPWSGTTLRQVLLRERNAGRRVHQGQVIGKGDWPAILDEKTFDRLVAMLRDPMRRKNPGGSEVVHLLSGIARCGRCGGTLRGAAAHQSGRKRQPRAYFCTSCYKLRRKADSVDEVVESVVVARLSKSDAASLFGGDPDAVRKAKEEKATVEARMAIAADQFADGAITGLQLERISAKLKPQLVAAERSIQAHGPSPELRQFAGSKAAGAWASASIDKKRAVIDAIMEVTILPSGAGKSFDPGQVRVEWKS